MRRRYLKNLSLKSKMALSATALFTCFVIGGSYFTFAYFEGRFQASISAQQFLLVSSLADSIDQKLRLSQNALFAVAKTVPPDVFTDVEAAQRFLDLNKGLQSIFDNNTAFITIDGKLFAEGRYVAGRRGKDLSFREWYQKTVAERKPHISAPFVSTHPPHHPVVLMTVPLFDRHGSMTGMLIGSLDLLGENFLAKISTLRIGRGGYLYVSDLNRTMIVHPDQSRIMKLAAAPGQNVLYDRAIDGFEGSAETVTSRGLRMLSSCKRLSMTSWILVANHPVEEAYAPINDARPYFIIVTVAATSVLLLINWLIMKHLMSPLQTITTHLERIPGKTGAERLVPVESSDEIGILAKSFNSMIERIDIQREKLKEQATMLETEVAEKELAQKALESKQHLLEALNDSLEEKIAAAVDDLRQRDQMLIQKSREAALGEMLHNIAHQWRQPLNNLALVIQGLQLSMEDGEVDRQEFEKAAILALDTIDFMSSTIDDFRNYYLPDKQKNHFDLQSLVMRTVSIIGGSLKEEAIALEVRTEGAPVVHGYPNEYAQVLLNILNNAKEALAEQEADNRRITLTIRGEDDRSVVIVADNAGGIPEAVLQRIFDPYFTTKTKGTGIGLFMSKMIIEKNMGGTLLVRNTTEGAEFTIQV